MRRAIMSRDEETKIADLRTSRVKLPIRFPPIMEAERPENVNHLQGNCRFVNSGVYFHINEDNGVVRNRLIESSTTKKILLSFITSFLISKKENTRKTVSNIAMPCTTG